MMPVRMTLRVSDGCVKDPDAHRTPPDGFPRIDKNTARQARSLGPAAPPMRRGDRTAAAPPHRRIGRHHLRFSVERHRQRHSPPSKNAELGDRRNRLVGVPVSSRKAPMIHIDAARIGEGCDGLTTPRRRSRKPAASPSEEQR